MDEYEQQLQLEYAELVSQLDDIEAVCIDQVVYIPAAVYYELIEGFAEGIRIMVEAELMDGVNALQPLAMLRAFKAVTDEFVVRYMPQSEAPDDVSSLVDGEGLDNPA